MKQYSPAFIGALLGMSVITHAHADTMKLTPEQIERLYIDEAKVPGKTLRCFQAGAEIVHEAGLRNVEQDDVKEGRARISAARLDKTALDVLLSADTTCTVVTRKAAE